MNDHVHACPSCRCAKPDDYRPPQPLSSNSWARAAAEAAVPVAEKRATGGGAR